jgi:sigma-E factor negative regulatory protein RseC
VASLENLIEETVRITAVDDGWITVERLEDNATCADCAQACPSSLLKRSRRNSLPRWRMPAQLAARPGDVWRVGMDPTLSLRQALRVYVIPLMGLLVGAFTGNSMAGDASAALGGLSGLALSLAGLWLSPPASHEISPVFIKKIHSA